MKPSSFFLFGAAEGEVIPTELTRGPWSNAHQHGGPPSGLIARALEQRAARDFGAVQFARLTLELVRPVPIAPLRYEVAVERPGKKVQILRASLRAAADGTEVLRATALSIRTTHVELPPLPVAARGVQDEVPAPPETLPEFEFPFFRDTVGYHKAVDVRFARGRFGKGPTTVWMRSRVPLFPGEELTPLQRAMIVSDSGNGVSIVLDTRDYTFINPDLTVHLLRMPEGEWICLDAITIPEANGVGLAESRLLDHRGPVGRALQSLIVEKRS